MYDLKQLSDLMLEVPPESIISSSIIKNESLSAVLFGFAPGTELSEHTASKPAILHFLEGEADLTLGSEAQSAGPGTWIHMPANLPHSIRAKTSVRLLLLLLK